MHDQHIVDVLTARADAARIAQRNNKEDSNGNNNSCSDNTSSTTGTTSSSSSSSSSAIRIPTAERLTGILTAISEELKDVLLYYSLPDLAATLQCTVPTHLEFRSALLNAGYRVSHFHHDPTAMKTDAPNSVVS